MSEKPSQKPDEGKTTFLEILDEGSIWEMLQNQLAECDEVMEKHGHIRTAEKPGDFSPAGTAKMHSDLWFAAKIGVVCWLVLENRNNKAAAFQLSRMMNIGMLVTDWAYRTEYHTVIMRGLKVNNGASRGGEVRAESFKEENKDIFREMQKHIDSGHTITRAADLASNAGFGTSGTNNRSRWNRHSPKTPAK